VSNFSSDEGGGICYGQGGNRERFRRQQSREERSGQRMAVISAMSRREAWEKLGLPEMITSCLGAIKFVNIRGVVKTSFFPVSFAGGPTLNRRVLLTPVGNLRFLNLGLNWNPRESKFSDEHL